MDIVIFGISGDLAHKKLIPALTSLKQKKGLPDDTRIIGFSRKAPERIDGVPFPYVAISGQYDNPGDFLKLKDSLRKDKKHLFYLALPASVMGTVLVSIHGAELIGSDDPAGHSLILIEKPFGLGFSDAESLTRLCCDFFREDQCLKIDHYAGKKELRQMEDIDFSLISKISFNIFEKATVDGRGGFYDETGALRDVGQNHILFMLSSFFKGLGARDEVYDHLTKGDDMKKYFFGQYEGFKDVEGVRKDSKTETFFSVPAKLDKPETSHIEIILQGGKALAETKASISYSMLSGEEKEIILASGTEAYENVFSDAIQGKRSSFLSDKEVLSTWRFIEEVEKVKENTPLVVYKVGWYK